LPRLAAMSVKSALLASTAGATHQRSPAEAASHNPADMGGNVPSSWGRGPPNRKTPHTRRAIKADVGRSGAVWLKAMPRREHGRTDAPRPTGEMTLSRNGASPLVQRRPQLNCALCRRPSNMGPGGHRTSWGPIAEDRPAQPTSSDKEITRLCMSNMLGSGRHSGPPDLWAARPTSRVGAELPRWADKRPPPAALRRAPAFAVARSASVLPPQTEIRNCPASGGATVAFCGVSAVVVAGMAAATTCLPCHFEKSAEHSLSVHPKR